MIASAPGKLILTGEYAVLDGAPAIVIAVNRRVTASRRRGPRGSSAFLIAVADEIARRHGDGHPATRAATELLVDSSAFYAGGQKLGLGSSAAVTVAATALALAAESRQIPVIDRTEVLAIATAAHASAQGVLGARGSGADIAAAVHGGLIAYQRALGHRVDVANLRHAKSLAVETLPAADDPALADRRPFVTAYRLSWPEGLTLIPFFTGASADTASLVAAVLAARDRDPATVNAALTAIEQASRAACQACAMGVPEIAANALLAALALGSTGIDRLAGATGVALVPPCVTRARDALRSLRGTAKTTGAGGGDIGIAVIPSTEDVSEARRLLIEAGCQLLDLSVDPTGVDLQTNAQ